jgi:hypothetical protein
MVPALLEACQIFGTLIADEQQVYDLNYLDDQLVLGIKGAERAVTMTVPPPREKRSAIALPALTF